MRYVVTALLALLLIAPARGEDKIKFAVKEDKAAAAVSNYLQDISVTIRAGFSEGSGTLFNRNGYTFIWTAGHVVDGLRSTRTIIDSVTGTRRTVVEFDDAQLIKLLNEEGRKVGTLNLQARVIKYSDADHGQDLAILLIRKRDFVKKSAVFHRRKLLPLGTKLIHIGSLHGQLGANSMTDGIVSQHGRLINKKIFDQVTVTAFPGSSGGGVYSMDGQYVGMVVRGAVGGFTLMVPVRRMRTWATDANVLWAMDPSVPMPSEEELKNMAIEDTGVHFGYRGASKKQLRTWKFLLHDTRPLVPLK